MALLKINNKKDSYTNKGRYKDDNARQDVFNYMIDSKHPCNSQKIQHDLIGGSHVDLSDPIKSMEEVAQQYNKDRGIRAKHIIATFSEDDGMSPGMIACAAEELSQKIGTRYQNVYAIHEDQEIPHIHMMVNTVSHVDGYKYNPKEDKKFIEQMYKETMEEFGVDRCRVYGR